MVERNQTRSVSVGAEQRAVTMEGEMTRIFDRFGYLRMSSAQRIADFVPDGRAGQTQGNHRHSKEQNR